MKHSPPRPHHHSPHSSPKNKNRTKGLKKLGVTEEDVQLAEKILEQIPKVCSDPNKAERILGYASTRLAREKALRMLGITEEEVDIEYAKILGSLGVGGRRRSFSLVSNGSKAAVVLSGPPNSVSGEQTLVVPSLIANFGMTTVLWRRHTFDTSTGLSKQKEAELKSLRKQARNSSAEIEALKRRVEELEKQLPVESNDTAETKSVC